jgi:hypothetical protein
MNLFKLIGLACSQRFKNICALPKTISGAVKHRQQQIIINELETERLDRIRNPSKYRGK